MAPVKFPFPLFVLSAVLLPLLSPAEDNAAISAIKETGGLVSPMDGGGWEVEYQHSGRGLTDEKLAAVTALKGIRSLNLRDTQITNAGLLHLKELVGLRRLHLERTAIGDAGIAHLAALENLEYLNLYSTKITDGALAHLTGLVNLEQLFVWQTEVTEEGAEKLQVLLPELRIVRGIDLSKVAMNANKREPEPLVDLDWIPVGGEEPPKSKTGDFITVTFENRMESAVKLFWVEYGGGLRFYADIAPGASRLQTTYSDATWVITDPSERPLGHFRTGKEIARAVIPKDN